MRATDLPALTQIYAPGYITNTQDLAKLIIDHLATISADQDSDTVFPARIRYAAEVQSDLRLIHIRVYGLTDDELARPYDEPADGAPCPADFDEIIATAADGRCGCVHSQPAGNRFYLLMSTLDESQQHALADQVGTVTVLTTPRRNGHH